MPTTTDIASIDAQIDWDQVRLKFNPHRPCKACGLPLDSIQSHRLTCSDACRQRLYRIRAAARKQLEQAPATPTTDLGE